MDLTLILTAGNMMPDAETSASSTITSVAIFLLAPLIIVFTFIIFIFYRQNRETQIRRQKTELELKALRAQMNPHFMFNCLNSIYHSIKQNRNEEAGKYLLRFAYLTRRILENSNSRWIALSEDVEILKAYLDLERMRTDESFDYNITVDDSINADNTSVLMLIIQPFVENSIWHGFRSGKDRGRIDIHIYAKQDKLHYEIRDNGKRSIAEHEKLDSGKRQSLGTTLVREQLLALKVLERRNADFDIEELLDGDGRYQGQCVHLFVPLTLLH